MGRPIDHDSRLDESREALRQFTVRPMSPDDYGAWMAVAGDREHGAWPGLQANQEHDFVAMTKGTNTSPAVFEGDRMVGGSLNLVKFDPAEQQMYLLVHMVGVDRRMQGRGVGNRLVDANYRLITDGQLPETVQEIRLTSDPLETPNVRFYMHSNGMTVAEYVPDVYKNLAAAGGEQHRGLPADRFLYRAQPTSEWVQSRILPNDTDYQQITADAPETAITFADYMAGQATIAGSPIGFVEVPRDLAAIKATSMDEARAWREYQATAFGQLFDRGYTAVDHIRGQEGQQDRIVLMREFDSKDPECLIRAVAATRK